MKIISLPNILKLILVGTLFCSLSVYSENIKGQLADVKDVVYNSIEFPSGDKYYKGDVVYIVHKKGLNGTFEKVKLVDIRSDGVKVQLEDGATPWVGLYQLLTKDMYEQKLVDIKNKKEADILYRERLERDKNFRIVTHIDNDYKTITPIL